MAINLSNVNITIQQFQEVASGVINAGEVRLTSDHSLGKVNDHVHSRGKNVVPVSHAEVLAVKDAFVKALQQNGVSVDEINRVRRELGLAPDGATDSSLASRSIRPLTRQLVRNILDRNAGTINDHAGATATLKIVKSVNLALGTDGDKMSTYFGSVVVEEEVTVDLTAEVPTVTNVRVAQRFDDSDDLEDRYLVETNPIPAPPPVPPPPVPGPAPVPGIPPVAPAGPHGIPPERQ